MHLQRGFKIFLKLGGPHTYCRGVNNLIRIGFGGKRNPRKNIGNGLSFYIK